MKQSAHKLLHLWEPVTKDDICVYFALLVLAGIVKKPTYVMYWYKDYIFSTLACSRIMRCDKFECIRKMLHFTYPLSKDPADSLTKLCGFLEKLRNFFHNYYTTNQNILVDKYLFL